MSAPRNFTSTQVINDTVIIHLLESMAKPVISSIERFLHIDTNSTRPMELVTVVKDGVEIFQDLVTQNYVKVVGDIASDVQDLIADKDL